MKTNINEFTVELNKDVDQHIIKYIDRTGAIPDKYIFTTKKRRRKLAHRAKLVEHVCWLMNKKYKMEGFNVVGFSRKPIYMGNRLYKHEYYMKFRKIG